MFVRVMTGVNLACGLLFLLCYGLQLLYTLLTAVKKPPRYPICPRKARIAILVCARGEEAVIGYLLESIAQQDYPRGCLDTFVLADNCTDGTAARAREGGATVFERCDPDHIGKGYALRELVARVWETKGEDYYDAYIIIDADNLLDRSYVSRMNDCFAAGNRVITSYRNSKNSGDNWLAGCSALWFMREARQLNAARALLKSSCSVSGTGFLVSGEILRELGGWPYFLLIEDIQFTIEMILRGERIAYCHDAILYDEQPTTFSQSWRQHVRWARGYLQILRRYGGKMLRGIFRGPHLACYDMIMTIAPAYFLTGIGALANLFLFVYSAITHSHGIFFPTLARGLLELYLVAFFFGMMATATEWRRIRCSTAKKLLYPFLFPIFLMLYLPEAIVALFTRPSWKPIRHTVRKSIRDMDEKE